MPVAAAILVLSLQGPIVVPRVDVRDTSRRFQVAESWDDLSQGQRDRALHNYRQYMELPDDKRRSIDQRYEKWKKMPGTDRDRFRKKHDEYRGLGLVDE